MKIKQIWDDLANDKSFANGLLFRRFSSAVKPDVYVALQHPENFLCVYIAISKTTEVNIANFSNLQEIQVDLFASPNEADKNILILQEEMLLLHLKVLKQEVFLIGVNQT